MKPKKIKGRIVKAAPKTAKSKNLRADRGLKVAKLVNEILARHRKDIQMAKLSKKQWAQWTDSLLLEGWHRPGGIERVLKSLLEKEGAQAIVKADSRVFMQKVGNVMRTAIDGIQALVEEPSQMTPQSRKKFLRRLDKEADAFIGTVTDLYKSFML